MYKILSWIQSNEQMQTQRLAIVTRKTSSLPNRIARPKLRQQKLNIVQKNWEIHG